MLVLIRRVQPVAAGVVVEIQKKDGRDGFAIEGLVREREDQGDDEEVGIERREDSGYPPLVEMADRHLPDEQQIRHQEARQNEEQLDAEASHVDPVLRLEAEPGHEVSNQQRRYRGAAPAVEGRGPLTLSARDDE